MPVQLSSVAGAGSAADAAPPPLAAVERLEGVTLGSGAARAVALQGRALLVYVRFGVLTLDDSARRAARALPGELVMADGQARFRYANASKAEDLVVVEIELAGPSERSVVAQRYFSDDEKSTKLCPIASRTGRAGSLSVQRDVEVALTRLGRWETVLADLRKSQVAWAIVLSGKATVNNEPVEHDASACVSAADELRIAGVSAAEVMVLQGAPRV